MTLKLHFKEEADGWPLLVLAQALRTLVLEGISHDRSKDIHACPHLSLYLASVN